MLEFENTIAIDRPIDEIFAFLSDFENILLGSKVNKGPGVILPALSRMSPLCAL